MKRIKILCLFICLSFSSYAQQEILKKKVTIPGDKYTAIELVQYVQEATSLSFSYKTKLLEEAPIISLKYSTLTISEVMQKITANTNADFVVINGIVVIKTKKEIQKIIKKTKESNPHAQIEYIEKVSKPVEKVDEIPATLQRVVSGKIVDYNTGELLIGAAVLLIDLKILVYTNEFGYFSFPILEGNYKMKVIYEGYHIEEISFTTSNSENLTLQIHSSSYKLDSKEILLKDTVLQNTDSIHTSTNPYVELNSIERLANITNPLRFLDTRTGIQKTGMISSDFSVLGGNYDQNLVLFDDAPIFNPSHLLGYDFIFIPYSIKDVQFYNVYQPAQYGGRLSSVLDIRSKDGNEKNFGIFTEINPIACYTSIESPIVKNHASLILNLRQSNLGWLFHDTNGNDLYNYYDGNLKLNFHTKKNRFYYSLYSGGDALNKAGFNSGSYGIKWVNNAHSLRWNHIINPSLFSNLTIYGSEYNYYLYINSGNIAYWNSNISSGGLKYDFTFFKTSRNTIRYGLDISGFQFNPGNIVYSNAQTSLFPTVSTGTIGTIAMYVSQNFEFKDNSVINWGIRMPLSRNAGPAVVYSYNSNYKLIDTSVYNASETYNSMASIEPRIRYYTVLGDFTFNVSYSKTTQVIQEISNSETQITSLDVWLPASPNIKPQISRQLSTGISSPNLFSLGLGLNANVFMKSMRNQISFENHANLLLNPLIEGEMRFGKTFVHGLMLGLRKEYLWVNYTYTRTQMKIEKDIIPTIFNRPHDLSIGGNYKLNKNILCTAQWNYLSGKPITTPTSFYEYQGVKVPVYDELLNSRLPAYHSLDVSMQISLKKSVESKWQHYFTFSIKNVYARKNPINISFNKSLIDNSIGVGSEVNEQAEYITTMLYAGTILPFISYAIKFN